MLCTSCGRQWGKNSIPTVCWWCVQQGVSTDGQDNLVTEQELHEIVHPRPIETADQAAETKAGNGEVS
jgi:hypothetical protein